jgi:DNA polymerase III subunit beta
MLVIAKDTITRALEAVRGALATKADPAIYRHVLLNAEAGKLRIAASTPWVHAQTMLEVDTQDFSIAVPAEVTEIVQRLDGPIAFTPTEKTLMVKANGATLRLVGLPGRDFPEPPCDHEWVNVGMPANQLRHALQFVEAALPTSDPRPYLNGVLLQIGQDAATFVASDGYMLGIVRMGTTSPKAAAFILPTKAVAEILRLLKSKSGDAAMISLGINRVRVTFAGVQLTINPVHAKFPDWRPVIGQVGSDPCAITVDREAFVAGVERVSLVARNDRRLAVRVEPKSLVMRTSNGEQAAEARLAAQSSFTGEVVLNRAHARLAGMAVAGDKLTVRIARPNCPLLFAGDSRSECFVLAPIVR